MKLFIILILFATGTLNAQKLKPGDPVPALKAWKWLKGKPVQEFQKGKIYLIEFGATWCKPCAAAIPELSRLAVEHKDIIVIGFFVAEQMSQGSGAYGDNVVKYLEKRNEQIKYTVALDDFEGSAQKAWVKNIAQVGIPFAVVIDRDGKIAWTGNSVKEAGEVIEKLKKMDKEQTPKKI